MSNSEHNFTIEDIVDSFAARLEKGERPSIEEYKRRYPELASQIESVLPAMVMLENIDSDPGERKLVVDDSIPEILGDYRIVQEVGRGGMGIVFEAQHSTMRRRVALKVLPKSAAEKTNYVNRFLMEARSAGQLHHTNIVPVFEVGQSDGLHYYSMQFIHGDNLDHVINDIRRLRLNSEGSQPKSSEDKNRQRSSTAHSLLSQSIASKWVSSTTARAPSTTIPFGHSNNSQPLPTTEPILPDRHGSDGMSATDLDESASTKTVFGDQSGSTNQRSRSQYHCRVAAFGIQVAEALAHAHEHGILHRDVKPANIILDTDGNVWVTDFGLAKLDSHDMTQTGDIVGTPRYMAPERFAGEADPRSDIYGLGLTLYELATLKCAFEYNRGTLAQEVASSSSVISPRKIDDSIPLDLETIILKSIEPQPGRRYQTAAEMANDLRLFLADRPIQARRATYVEKLWRICRRNPVSAALSICLVVLLTIITAGSIQFARNEFRNRKESQKSLFYAKLDQAKMRVYSGRPGQRLQAMKAIGDAVNLLPVMGFDDQELAEKKFHLRSEVIAATSLTDINRKWRHTFEPGWGTARRYIVDKSTQYFAEGHKDGRIRVRSIADSSVKWMLPSGKDDDPSWLMHFSPNARYLIAKYHQGNVHDEFLTIIWDLENDCRQAYVTRHTHEFCFSNDSRKIAITYRDRAEVVDLETGMTIKTIYPNFSSAGNLSQIVFNSDASAVAISKSASGTVEFWDITKEAILTDIVQCSENILCIDWDSDRGIFAAGCHRGVLHYWLGDLSHSGTAIQLHQNSIHELHLHPHCELVATTAWDATTRISDLGAGKEVLRLENHKLSYNGFCADGCLSMLDENEELGIWQVELPLIQTVSTPNEESGGFSCCIHPKFNHIVARTNGDDVEVWDLSSRKRFAVHSIGTPRQVAFADSGNYLYASGSKGLKRWTVNQLDDQWSIDNEIALIDTSTGDFDLFNDGKRMLLGIGSRLKIINLADGQEIRELGVHANLNRPKLTADNRYALTGTWRGVGIKVWDVDAGRYVATAVSKTGSAVPLPHPKEAGKFYSSRRNTTEFELNENASKVSLTAHRKLKYDGMMSLLNDGQQMLVQKNSYNLVLLDSETQEEIARFSSSGQSRIIDRRISIDGKMLVLACFDNLQILDLSAFSIELRKLGLDWN